MVRRQGHIQVGADIERVAHGAEEECQPRPQTVVDGTVGQWSDDTVLWPQTSEREQNEP